MLVIGPLGSKNKITHDLRVFALQYAPAALAELNRLALHAKSEAVRVAAIREVLDRAVGRAKIAVDLPPVLEVDPIRPGMSTQEAMERFQAVLHGATIRRRMIHLDPNGQTIEFDGKRYSLQGPQP